jgi:hypothetical protein
MSSAWQSSMGLEAPNSYGDTTMLTKSKIALSLVLVLGAASAATAATKHPVRHQRTAVERQVPATAYQSYGSARGPAEPEYMHIQDQDFRESNGFR